MMKSIAFLLATAVISSNAFAANSFSSPEMYLASIFKTDKDKGCWLYSGKGNHADYCYSIVSQKKITTQDGKTQIHVLLASNAFVNGVEESGSILQGAVAAFIFDEKSNNTVTPIAQNKMIEVGSYGKPPQNWQLVKLNNSDAWGWRSTTHYMQMGIVTDTCDIIAQHKNAMKNICKVDESYSNEASCTRTDPKECNAISSSVTASLMLVPSKTDSFYPLQANVSGSIKGKPINKQYEIPFAPRSWSYKVPNDWVFKQFNESY